MPRVVHSCVLLGTLAIVTGCPGGFYKIDDSLRRSLSSGKAPTEPGYITAKIDLENKTVLTSSMYSNERDGHLTHLFVYASFSAGTDGPKQIPLYLVDFEHGSIDETRGDELISHYPFNLDSRGKPLFSIETRALKKNAADTALKIWSITKDFSQNAATLAMGPQTAPIFTALNSAADMLRGLAATEQAHTVRVALPDQLQATTFADIYLIEATNKEGNVLPDIQKAADAFTHGNIALCPQNGANRVCLDGRPYTTLPYIIVTFEVRGYVHDPLLLPEQLNSNCTGIDSAIIGAARARVVQVGAVSSTQRALEESLADRLEALLNVRKRSAAGDATGIFNSYDAYLQLGSPSPSSVYDDHYRDRFKSVDQCMDTEIRKLAGFDDVVLIEKFLNSPLDENASEGTLDQSLLYVTALVQTDSDRKNSNPFARAISRIVTISNILYQHYYASPIRNLRAAKQRDEEHDKAADDLERRYTNTNCDRCRSDGVAAVATYRALKSTDAEIAKTTALAKAGDALAALKVAATASGRQGLTNNDVQATLSNLMQAVAKVQTPAAGKLFKNLPDPQALSKLDAVIKESNRVLAK